MLISLFAIKIKDGKKQTHLNDFMDAIIEPFRKDYSEYDILRHVAGNSKDSPAVAAVKKLKRNVSTSNNYQMTPKDAAAMGSFGISRNSNIVHDVAARKLLKTVVAKPSEYVDGFHLSQIKEQAKLLKEYKKLTPIDLKSFTTPPAVNSVIHSTKAMARSYRNGLDNEYVKESMSSQAFVTPESSRSEDSKPKPKYGWIKEIRKECIRQMTKASTENKAKLVSLIRIINHQDPLSKFEDIKNVYDDSMEMNESVTDIVTTMMCFV